MNSTKFRSIINFSTAVCLVAAAGVAIWGWTTTGQITSQPVKTDSLRSTQSATAKPPDESRGLAANTKELVNSEVWRRSLQSGFRVKTNVSKAETKPALPPPPKPLLNDRAVTTDLGLRLVGTVIEKGRSMAIVVDLLGKLDFCAEGAELQLDPPGIRVDSIATDSISVSLQGRSLNWLMGHSLRFETFVQPTESSDTQSSDTGTPNPRELPSTKPKMSIEDELELINGNGTPMPIQDTLQKAIP